MPISLLIGSLITTFSLFARQDVIRGHHLVTSPTHLLASHPSIHPTPTPNPYPADIRVSRQILRKQPRISKKG
jgi:hypothetical protein